MVFSVFVWLWSQRFLNFACVWPIWKLSRLAPFFLVHSNVSCSVLFCLKIEIGGCCGASSKTTVVGGWAWAWWLVTDVQRMSLEVNHSSPLFFHQVKGRWGSADDDVTGWPIQKWIDRPKRMKSMIGLGWWFCLLGSIIDRWWRWTRCANTSRRRREFRWRWRAWPSARSWRPRSCCKPPLSNSWARRRRKSSWRSCKLWRVICAPSWALSPSKRFASFYLSISIFLSFLFVFVWNPPLPPPN